MSDNAATNAILTRTRAKFGKSLKSKDYNDLLNCNSISEIVIYLKQNTRYSGVLANVKESAIHRGNLEKLIYTAICKEIDELVKFQHSLGSDTLDFIGYKEDARMILAATRFILSGNTDKFIADTSFGATKEKSKLYKNLLKARTLKDVGDALSDTIFKSECGMYYSKFLDFPLTETHLYRIAFNYGFEVIDKEFSGMDRIEMHKLLAIFTETHDLSMIYRNKNFADDVNKPQRLLIGKRAYITDRVLKELIDAKNADEFLDVLWTTTYKRYSDYFVSGNFALFMSKVRFDSAIRKIHFSSNPSVVLFAYVMVLDAEYQNLSSIIEGVRYSLSADDISEHLIKG